VRRSRKPEQHLQEAVALVLEANRTLAQKDAPGPDVIREALKVRRGAPKPDSTSRRNMAASCFVKVATTQFT
jgi:hypothetical protein